MKQISLYIDALKSDVVFQIGGNESENFDIIDAAASEDIWFHINNHPSAHVIACIPLDKKIDKKQLGKIVKQGAVLCKQYSKCASHKNVEIVYTRIKFVEKSLTKIGSVNVNATVARTISI